MFARVGILGILGILVLAVWFIGWAFVGVHDARFHVLFLVGLLLCIAQGVRRVAA